MTHVRQHDTSERSQDSDCAVGLVLTGGTIGAEEDNLILSVGTDPTRTETELLERVWPGDGNPIVTVATPVRKLSENLLPEDWLKIAHAIRDLVNRAKVCGVLVLHGTDTMGYTAAALSFLLCDLDCPIVLTGSNLPSTEKGSDAEHNVHAALVALRSLTAGTYVAFAGELDLPGQVYLGTRVRKLRASGEAFKSVNRNVIGTVKDGVLDEKYPHTPLLHAGFRQGLDDRVLALRLYPGLDLSLTLDAVKAGALHGVVVELYASATGPTDTDDRRFSLPWFIEECAANNVVVATTVSEVSAKNGKTYATTLAIKRAGGVFLDDMTTETATVKLMWALAQTSGIEAVCELMRRPIAGEIDPH
jgi:L-asparaginase